MRAGLLAGLGFLACAACAATPTPASAPATAPAPDPDTLYAADPPRSFDFRLSGRAVQGGLLLGQAPVGTRSLSLDGKPVRLTPDGRFMLGFGREAGPEAVLEAVGPGGQRYRAPIAVGARSWKIENLPTLSVRPSQSPEYEARRQAELARIRAARGKQVDALDWVEQPFSWPAIGRISGVYGSQRILGGVPANPHYGVDLAKPAGSPILAPAGGIVTLASPPAFSLEGNMVFIDHGFGLSSAFLHLSRVDVREGQRVERGQVIGLVGATGRATGPHLHWAVVWNGVRIDPELLVPPMPAAPAPAARP